MTTQRRCDDLGPPKSGHSARPKFQAVGTSASHTSQTNQLSLITSVWPQAAQRRNMNSCEKPFGGEETTPLIAAATGAKILLQGRNPSIGLRRRQSDRQP